jgi:hypothetical protein
LRMWGIDPDRTVKSTGINITKIAKGKIVESWAEWDALGMMLQLGAVSLLKKVMNEILLKLKKVF